MDYFLSDLLHYDISQKKHADLKKGLREYALLLSALIESLEAFEEGALEKFDSLVGENACQIRAINLALIHSNYSPRRELKALTHKSKETILDLLETKINSLMALGISLKEVINEYNLEIPLDETEAFLLKSYLLSEMKEVFTDSSSVSLTRQEKCNPVNLKKICENVSYSFSKKLASHLRQRLSKFSVEFVRQIAHHLADPLLLEKVSNSFVCEYNALHSLPMFWTYKILLRFAKMKDIPLIVHVKFVQKDQDEYILVDNHYIFFKPIRNESGELFYIETSPSADELKKAAWVVEGVAVAGLSWDRESLVKSITNSILAGAADHRQYPDPNLLFPTEDPEFQQFKTLAKKQGFSLENPTTFLINHVYAARTESIAF